MTQSLRDMWRAVWGQRWLVLIPAVIGFLVLTVYAATLEDIYQSEAVLLPRLGKPSDRYIAPAMEASAREMLRSSQTRLVSYDLLRRVVRDQGLYPETRERKGGMEKAVKRLRKNLSVTVAGATGMIKVAMKHSGGADPGQVAADAVNHLTEIYLHDQRSKVDQGASEIDDFLSKEERRMRGLLEDAEQKLERFRADHPLELPEDRDTNLATIQLESRNIDQYVARQQAITQEFDDYTIQAYNLKRTMKTATRVVESRNEAREMLEGYQRDRELELIRLRGVYNEDSEIVKQKEDELAEVKRKLEAMPVEQTQSQQETVEFYEWMLGTLEDRKKQLKNESILCENRISESRKEIEKARQRIANSSELSLEYNRLIRAVDDARSRREALMSSSHQARMSKEVQQWDPAIPLEVQQKAYASSVPLGPQRLSFSFFGLAAGLALGAGIAILRMKLDDGVHRDRDLKALMPGTIIVTLPEVSSGAARGTAFLANMLGWLTLGALAGAAAVIVAISNRWWGDMEMLAPLLDLFK